MLGVPIPGTRFRPTVFDASDGIRSHAGDYYPSPRIAKSADGRLWFLPLDGISVVDPRRLPLINKLPPPVHIEQITADGKIYDASQGQRLPARVRDLAIDYTALSLVEPEKVHFKYMLEGQDGTGGKWSTSARRNTRTLLPAITASA